MRGVTKAILLHCAPLALGFAKRCPVRLIWRAHGAARSITVFQLLRPHPQRRKMLSLRPMSLPKPSQAEICQLLGRIHSIAVVGLSPNADRPSFRVAQGMQALGYRIIPVRPRISAVLGETAYPDLASVPHKIDLVNVFRAPEHVPAIVDECIALGVSYLWLQDGVINEEAALRAQAAGITVVMDMCIWRDGRDCGRCVA